MIILYRKKSYYCSWWYKKSSRLKTKNLLSRKIEHFQRPDTYIYIFFGFLIEKRIICHKNIHSHLVIICFDTFASRIYLLNSLLTTCTPLTPSPSCHLNYPPSYTEIYANLQQYLSFNKLRHKHNCHLSHICKFCLKYGEFTLSDTNECFWSLHVWTDDS